LRRLLAPESGRSDFSEQLVRVRHLAAGEVNQEALEDARLAVVAGIREPGAIVPLLRDFVEQGGQLLIAAGAEFDSAAWNEVAWKSGEGILPLPLAPQPIGRTPEEIGDELQPFFLAFDSLSGENYFQLAGVPEAELRELYAEPFFFKAVKVDASSETLEAWKHLEPRILACYDLPGRLPFLVSRRIGRGEVMFCSTGLLSSWTTLPKTNAVLIFDRILRGMIESTLPRHNFPPSERMTLPLPQFDQGLLVKLVRP
jgi:hypothetical protein